MVTRFSAGFVALSLLGVSFVSANPVSLFLPGAEGDEPFTADFLGTDSMGHTTWRIGIGSASGSFTATDGAGAYPSITLLEGSSDIHIIQALPTSGAVGPDIFSQAVQDCVYSTAAGIQAGAAVCTIRLEAATETTTMVQTISGNVVEVQVAATVTGGAGSGTQTASGGAAATQTQTGNGNGAGKMTSVAVPALVLFSLVNAFNLLLC